MTRNQPLLQVQEHANGRLPCANGKTSNQGMRQVTPSACDPLLQPPNWTPTFSLHMWETLWVSEFEDCGRNWLPSWRRLCRGQGMAVRNVSRWSG